MRLALAILMLWGALATQAATITAASASRADVGTAWVSASPAGTVIIPPGTNNWATKLDVTNQVSFFGSGTNLTILGMSGGQPLFEFYTANFTSKTQLVADMQFVPGTSPSSGAFWYINGCNTNNNRFVVSNMFFNGTVSPCPFVIGAIGVMKKCRWNITSDIGLYIYHENWNGELFSRGSFYAPVDYNSDEFWIVEDSVVNGTAPTYAFTDAYRGARYMVRYTMLTNRWLEAHGTESGFVGGTRAVISYNNIFHGDGTVDYAHNMRSATLIAFSNRVHNAGTAGNALHLDSYRKTINASPWGAATGENPIDGNDATVYDAGRASGGGEKYLVDATKSWTPNQWVGYQLARTNPYTPSKTALTDFRSGYISSNSSTVITLANNIDGQFPNIYFTNGNDYRILKIHQAFDQPGVKDTVQTVWSKNTALTNLSNVATAVLASHGLITGDYIIMGQLLLRNSSDAEDVREVTTMAQVTVVNSSTYTYTLYTTNGYGLPGYTGDWYKIPTYSQGLDPCYEWQNYRSDDVELDFAVSYAAIRANEHYYNDTTKPGFNPTAYPWGTVSASSSAPAKFGTLYLK